jgi:hypothetical protein
MARVTRSGRLFFETVITDALAFSGGAIVLDSLLFVHI